MLEYGTSPRFWFNVWEAVEIISCGCPDFRHIGTFAYFEFWRSGCVTSNAFLKTNLAFFFFGSEFVRLYVYVLCYNQYMYVHCQLFVCSKVLKYFTITCLRAI